MVDINNNENISLDLDLDLVINILKEEHIIDEMTALELKKRTLIKNIQELFVLLAQYGIALNPRMQEEISLIYDIVSKEGILAGDYKTVKVKTASRIRSLIGKWNPPSPGQMKIGEVLEDIFIKVARSAQGVYYYYTGKCREKVFNGKYVYKLIICEKVSIFVDLNRKISYHIVGSFNL